MNEFIQKVYDELNKEVIKYNNCEDCDFDKIVKYSTVYRNLLEINQINATTELSKSIMGMVNDIDISKLDINSFLKK